MDIAPDPAKRRRVGSDHGCDQTLGPRDRRRAVAEMLCATQEFGLANAIRRYLAVMPARLLKCVVVKAGCEISARSTSLLTSLHRR